PHLANLRTFQFGFTSDESSYERSSDRRCWFQCHLSGNKVHDLVRRMPRLEELRLFAHNVDGHKLFALPMPNLRVLQIYHSNDYPLDKVAKHSPITNHTHVVSHT